MGCAELPLGTHDLDLGHDQYLLGSELPCWNRESLSHPRLGDCPEVLGGETGPQGSSVSAPGRQANGSAPAERPSAPWSWAMAHVFTCSPVHLHPG